MQINLRCRYVRVPQGLTHQEEVLGIPEQVRGERVPEGMRVNPLGDPGLVRQTSYQLSQPPATYRFLPGEVGEEVSRRGEIAATWQRRFEIQPGLQSAPGRAVEPQAPVLLPFAFPDPQAPRGEVQVPVTQVDKLSRPEAGV